MNVRRHRAQQDWELAELGCRMIGSTGPQWMAETIAAGVLGHAPEWPDPPPGPIQNSRLKNWNDWLASKGEL